jgi:hypothetical protein
MIGALLSLSLAAAPATLLVWGGGKTPEDADKAMADYKAKSEAGKWSTYVKLAAGFPLIVASDKVPGMNPGFHVVVLGACDEKDGAAALGMFKVLEPSIYSKASTAWSLAQGCPAGAGRWKWGPAARAKGKDDALAAVAFFTGKDDNDQTMVAVRHEPKGGTPTVKFFELMDCYGDGELTASGVSLSIDTTCITGRCTSYGHSMFRTTFSLKNGEIVEKDKETEFIDKASCD